MAAGTAGASSVIGVVVLVLAEVAAEVALLASALTVVWSPMGAKFGCCMGAGRRVRALRTAVRARWRRASLYLRVRDLSTARPQAPRYTCAMSS